MARIVVHAVDKHIRAHKMATAMVFGVDVGTDFSPGQLRSASGPFAVRVRVCSSLRAKPDKAWPELWADVILAPVHVLSAAACSPPRSVDPTTTCEVPNEVLDDIARVILGADNEGRLAAA